MDFDLFLSPPRWEILKIIAEKPSSPLEIAEKLKTTVSYVSQQLKLLDAAGLIVKTKTGIAEKGKPRSLFSLSKEVAYLSILTKNLAKKKLFYLDEHHKRILNIWLLDDSSLHYFIEKFFWKLEENLNEIEGIFLEISIRPKFLIITHSKKIKAKIEEIVKKLGKKVDYVFISEKELEKFDLRFLVSLHDPQNLLDVKKELKGGNEKDEENKSKV